MPELPVVPEAAERSPRATRWLRVVAPLILGGMLLAAWEIAVRALDIPAYKLAAPSAIA